jgi:hypothetical protein
VIAGMLGAVTVSGCAGHDTAALPAPVPTPTMSSVLREQLPITAYELAEPQVAQAEYLGQRLQQRCMQGFGFDYLPGLSTAYISQSVRIMREFDTRRYGVTDPVAIQTFGYQLPSWTAGAAPTSGSDKLPAPELAVLIGTATAYHDRPVPSGGCSAQAEQELSQAGISSEVQQSGGSGAGTLAGDIRSSAFDQAQSDPRVRAVFAKWSACMRAYDYSYGTPFDAGADPRWSTTGPPSAAEIETAERDLGCKLRVNLLGVEFAVESDYENIAIARNASALAAIRTEVGTETTDIRRAMAEYGT